MELSVIIPSRNRPQQLLVCLQSVIRMFSLTSLSYELIVVDDGSNLAFRQQYLELKSTYTINFLNSGGNGPAAARNLGALNAQGEWIYFIDDDVIIDESSLIWWSKTHLPSVAGYQGITRVKESAEWNEVIPSRTDFVDGFGSGNIIYKRDLFLRLGGFDEAYFLPAFGIHFREDTDLGLRFLRHGYELPVTESMSAKHPSKKHKDPWFLITDARKYFLEPYFKFRNPEASHWIGSAFKKGKLGTYQSRGAISLLFVFLLPLTGPLWQIVPTILLILYILLSLLIFRGIRLGRNFWIYVPVLLLFYPLVHGTSYLLGLIFGPKKPKLIKGVHAKFKYEK